ncbi:MAG: CBS domain-containing protein [Anaerolineales bacterium]|nr:CBS domain-containing protein [Anaerolineales bacterium]
MTTVKDLLLDKGKEVWTIAPEATVFSALQLLADHDIGALPVVSAGRLVGILSERDYARRGILAARGSKSTPVREVMTASVFWVNPEHSLEHCMTLMTHKHVRHLPVLNTEGRLVGVISIGDVLKAIIAEQHRQLARLDLYQTSPHSDHEL